MCFYFLSFNFFFFFDKVNYNSHAISSSKQTYVNIYLVIIISFKIEQINTIYIKKFRFFDMLV